MQTLPSYIGVWAFALLAGLALALSVETHAQEPQQSAHEFAEGVKDELVAVIRNKAQLEEEGGSEKYVAAVQAVLEPVVDFDYIARGVMGRHAEEASSEQRRRFVEEFKQSLVKTYANGLAGYGDYDITVVPPEEDVTGKSRVSVWLNVSKGNVTHRLAFSTRLDSEGGWKVTNMILNGVNLGRAFRGQFDSAMKQHNGNIDAVIENWRV